MSEETVQKLAAELEQVLARFSGRENTEELRSAVVEVVDRHLANGRAMMSKTAPSFESLTLIARNTRTGKVEWDRATDEEVRDAWVWSLPLERITRILGPAWVAERLVIYILHKLERSRTDSSLIELVPLTPHEVRCALARTLPGNLAGVALEPEHESDERVGEVARYEWRPIHSDDNDDPDD